MFSTLQWHHNGLYGVLSHQPYHCLRNRLFGRRSKITSKLRVTGLCAGNSPGAGEFPTQMTSNAENVSIWWRHHELQPSRWKLLKIGIIPVKDEKVHFAKMKTFVRFCAYSLEIKTGNNRILVLNDFDNAIYESNYLVECTNVIHAKFCELKSF